LPMAGGEAERLVDAKEGASALRWSPDGRQIAFLMAEPKPAALDRREKDRDDGRVADKDERRARIWVLDVGSRTVRQVTSGTWRVGQIEWSGGAELIASATDKPASDQWTDRIFTVSLSDGRFTPIATPRGPLGGFAISPDGTRLVYAGARTDGPEAHDLWIQPIFSAGPARNLTALSIDRPVSQPRWIDDHTMMAHVARGFASALATIDQDGVAENIAGLEVNPSAFARASTGTIAYVGETTTQPPE